MTDDQLKERIKEALELKRNPTISFKLNISAEDLQDLRVSDYETALDYVMSRLRHEEEGQVRIPGWVLEQDLIETIDIQLATSEATFAPYLQFRIRLKKYKEDMKHDEAELDEEKADFIKNKMENEGFDYCFDGYSSWPDVKDPVFHDIRKGYIKAKRDLERYVDSRTSELK